MPLQTEPVVHVIDDDDAARHSLKFLIECAGYRVADYDSALAFLAALGATNRLAPGCIVTDVRMPEMTGLELVDRLKQQGVAEPVIVITGHADVPMAIQAMKAGVVDFIEKPFGDDAILSVIRETLDRRSHEAEADEEKRAAADRLASLSQREREVLERLVEGKANKVIAFQLGISVRTVEVYRANVMTKMQVKSLPQLVRAALGV
jgi:two-component system response regulator FixJ